MKEKELERLTNLKQIEKELHQKQFKNIVGIDEAGRGPLAGPVVVAGVIMPEDSMIEGVNDSKKVSEKKRELLYDQILEEAISYSVAIIGQDVIDDINILNATKHGVTSVVKGLDLHNIRDMEQQNILLQLKNMDYVQYIEEVLQDILSNEKIIFQPVVH